MSNFLNNFSPDKYKSITSDEQVVEPASLERQPSNEEVEHSPNELKLELTGAAFDDEKISIDTDYNQFLYKRTIIICLTIFAIIVVLVGTNLYLHQTVAITLVDKSQTEAEKWLKSNDVNYDLIEVESDQYKRGTVISQSIPSGEKIGVLDLQTIEVSTGPDMDQVVKLTDLTGKSKQEVSDFIDSKLLVNTSISYEYSDKVDADQLIRIDFEDDSVTADNYTRAATANFIISKGSREDKKNVKVLNFVSQTTDKVYEWNQDTGIMIDEQQISSDIPAGYIVSQSSEPGTMLGYGDILTLEVSKGPGEYTPYLIGYNLDEATSIASDSGISLEPTERYSDSSAGIIISQDKSEGESIYPEEESLEVDVSLGKPFISDLTGASLGDLVMVINELNTQGANLTYTTTDVAISDEDREQGVTSGTIKSMSNSNSFVSPGSNIKVKVYS